MLKWIFGGGLISITLFAFSIHFGKVDVHINIGVPTSAAPPRVIGPKPKPEPAAAPKPSISWVTVMELGKGMGFDMQMDRAFVSTATTTGSLLGNENAKDCLDACQKSSECTAFSYDLGSRSASLWPLERCKLFREASKEQERYSLEVLSGRRN
jgi:hypothetical protein